MKKFLKIFFSFIFIYGLLLLTFNSHALAYYNRGKVTLTLGTNSVSIKRNEKITISAVMDPASRTGLKGCGDPGCPQTCGGMCGDEVTGECHCAGDEKITRHAIANVESSNAFVAKAKYSQSTGLITITGLNPGTAEIKVTGTLWQYTDSAPQTITVSVSNSEYANNSTNNSATTPSSKNVSNNSRNHTTTVNSKPSTTIKSNKASTKKTAPNTKKIANNYTTKGKMGLIDIVGLTSTMVNKDTFQNIEGQNRKITFQKKDTSNNILYSWTFNGKDIKNPTDIDMGIEFPDTASSDIKPVKNLKNPLSVFFNYHGELPGKATIYVNVSNKYSNGTILSLYYYNEKIDKLELINNNVKVQGGYASFNISHCSKYFLSQGLNNTSKYMSIIIISIILVILATISIVIVLRQKKYLNSK